MKEYQLKELDLKEMGRRIRLRRELQQLSREQLAEKVDVTCQFIADLEYGNTGMSIQTLYRMSQALKVPSDYFLAGKTCTVNDGEAMRIREEICCVLQQCSARQLQGVSQIVRIFEDETRSR